MRTDDAVEEITAHIASRGAPTGTLTVVVAENEAIKSAIGITDANESEMNGVEMRRTIDAMKRTGIRATGETGIRGIRYCNI